MKRIAYKSVTLVTTPGKGMAVVEQLFQKGYSMVDIHHARGCFIGGPTKKNGTPVESEQEIITCVVPAAEANEVFALIYEIGNVNQPNGGFMYMQDLMTSTQVVLPRDQEKSA